MNHGLTGRPRLVQLGQHSERQPCAKVNRLVVSHVGSVARSSMLGAAGSTTVKKNISPAYPGAFLIGIQNSRSPFAQL